MGLSQGPHRGGETEAQGTEGTCLTFASLHRAQCPCPCFLFSPHSPVPLCTPPKPCCTPRWAALGLQRIPGHSDSRGWHRTTGTQLGWGMAGAGDRGAAAAPHRASPCAPHVPAPPPRGTRQPGLCPRPFVWQSAPELAAAPDPASASKPLRGSGCGPAASGKDAVGITNGRQPPHTGKRQERGQRALPHGTSWLTPQYQGSSPMRDAQCQDRGMWPSERHHGVICLIPRAGCIPRPLQGA